MSSSTLDLAPAARKITLTLFTAQSLVSAAIIAAATLNSIVGAQLGSGAQWAGVPTAVFLLASAGSSFLWGYLMDWLGRRAGLVLGLALGAAGAGLAFRSVVGDAFVPFLAGLALMGTASAAMLLGRFASAEVHPPASRGRAISNVVIGGTVGAVVGPLLVGPSGRWVSGLGLNELAGAYGAGVVLLAVAAAIAFAGLRPDPRDLGREVARLYPDTSAVERATQTLGQILRRPAVQVAMLVMVVGQVVMVAVMVITSLHMRVHQHGLGDVSLVISSHTLGMYAFSIFSGRLADRWGRRPVILLGACTLVLACVTAPLSPNVLPLAVSLFLLGLGWNFCFVGGSTLLSDQLSPAERARTQGFNDLLVGLAAAAASLSSGVIFDAAGYGVMVLIGAAVALLPVVVVVQWMRRQPSLGMAP